MRRWTLHIDESGDFGSHYEADGAHVRTGDAHVVVAGVLADSAATTWSEKALRNALAGVAGWMPRPLHMAHLNAPAMHAVALTGGRARVAGTDDDRVRAAADVCAAMKVASPAAFDAVAVEVRAQRLPAMRDVRRLDAAYDAVPRANRRPLDQVTRAVRVDLLRRLQAELGAASQAGDVRWLMTTESAPRASQPLVGQPGDRYVDLLVELIARAVDALAAEGGVHEVHVSPLVRDVFDSSVGIPRPLHANVIRPLVASRLGVASSAGAFVVRRIDQTAEVRVHLGPAVGYGADVHPLHVCADVAANLLRSGITARTLDELHRFGHDEVQARLERAGHTGVATAGTPAAVVAAARAGIEARPSMNHTRQLAREQAQRWAAWYDTSGHRWEVSA